MEAGTLILVHLIAPKEKYWGVLLALGPAGLTVRGLDVDLFDDWARQSRAETDPELGLATIFFPLHRIEKIFEDARVGSVASYQERFLEIVGRDVRQFLRPAPAPPTEKPN